MASEFHPNYTQFSQERIDLYESVTAVTARELLAQAQLLPQPPASIVLLDNASGAGCVSAVLIQGIEKAGKSLDGVKIVCGDISPVILELLSQRVAHHGWGKVVEVKNFDARRTSLPDDHFTHVMSNIGVHEIFDEEALLQETYRVLRPSGKAGFTSFKKSGWFPSIKTAFPSYTLPPALSDHWVDPKVITASVAKVGFTDIQVRSFAFTTRHNVPELVDVLSYILDILKDAAAKERYASVLKEAAGVDGKVDFEWEALITTARKQ